MASLFNVFPKLYNFLYTAGLYLITPFQDMDLLVFTNPFSGEIVEVGFPGAAEFTSFIETYLPVLGGTSLLDVFAFIFTAGLLSVLIVRIVDIILP